MGWSLHLEVLRDLFALIGLSLLAGHALAGASRRLRPALHATSLLVEGLTAEFILTRLHWPNGGAAILFRTCWTTGVLFVLARLVGLLWQADTSNSFLWLGAIVAACYTTFQTRFAKQWAYLAGIYNQIIYAECQASPTARCRGTGPRCRPGTLEGCFRHRRR